MNYLKSKTTLLPGIFLCFMLALFSSFAGNRFPVIGGPIFAILLGMILSSFFRKKQIFQTGVSFSSKILLQLAVVLLGFGMNLNLVFITGKESLPIILATISTSLIVSFFLYKRMNIPVKTAILVGIGSSICGGSAIAATAPVIHADDDDIAQSIAVIFLFNVLAALIFPHLGTWLGFSHHNGTGFGLFAGTAINDTSSVTAAASTWDSLYHLGSSTLQEAVTVKLTRTLAIIPITSALAFYFNRKDKVSSETKQKSAPLPKFIIFFLLVSAFTTLLGFLHIDTQVFQPLKELSKFFIIVAMSAIGLGSNVPKLIKNGKKPILLGFCCWISIILVSLILQHFLIGDF